MKDRRFIRKYQVIITTTTGQVTVSDPIRVAFDVSKSIVGGLNTSNIALYNLSQSTRNLIAKEKFQLDKVMKIELIAGYKDNANTILKGTILNANSVRDGVDIITKIEATDGGEALSSNYVVKSYAAGVDEEKDLIESATGLDIGIIEPIKKLVRPKVVIGNLVEYLRKKARENGYTFYIDDEKAYIVKDEKPIFKIVTVVDAETGLIDTPLREGYNVLFKTLMNPAIKVGSTVKLSSSVDKRDAEAGGINGDYIVTNMQIQGDSEGSEWSQQIECVIPDRYKGGK